MGLIMTVVMVVFGFIRNWQNIDPIFWWILGIFWIQDLWDVNLKRKIEGK